MHASHYGFIPDDPTADNTPAWNYFLATGDYDIELDAAKYYFQTKPDPVNRAVYIEGQGKVATYLIRNYSPSSNFEGFIEFKSGSGSRIEHLSIFNTGASGKGVGLKIEPEDGDNISWMVMDSLYISGDHPSLNWNIGLWMHGAKSRGASPRGIRNIEINDTHLFASNYALMDINSVHNAIIECSLYPAGGSSRLVKVNAWPDDATNHILMRCSSAFDLDVRNARDSIFVGPSINVVAQVNTNNIKFV